MLVKTFVPPVSLPSTSITFSRFAGSVTWGPCMGIVKTALESPCPPRPTLPILHRPVMVPCSLLVSLFPCRTRDAAVSRLRPYFSLADLLTESTLSLSTSPPAPPSPQFLTAPPPWTAGPTASPLKTTAARAPQSTAG